MTATELDDIAIIKAVSALIDLNPDASATTKAETAIRAYLAAIGAGGQAVEDSLWVPAKPEHAEIGWTYDFDQTERLSRAAEKATGYDATIEVVEFVMAEADRRHKSALSQPHPADERVVEALRAARDVVDACACQDVPTIEWARGVRDEIDAALSGSGAGWRDMESAPKDWADVLLYVPNLNSDWRNVCEGYFDAENVTWRSPMFGEIAPTHWMPLPSAPDRRPA